MAPTLSGIKNYDPHWLLDDAQHSQTTAKVWQDSFSGLHRMVSDLPWTGTGQEQALPAYATSSQQAASHAAVLSASAATTVQTYHELINQKNALLQQVKAIEAGDRFQVSEALVVEPGPEMTETEMALGGEAEMATKQAALTSGITQLYAADAAAGAQVSSHVATLADAPMMAAHGTPVQMVDFNTNGSGSDPFPPFDTPSTVGGTPTPQPSTFIPQLQGALASPPMPQASAPPMPSTGPLPTKGPDSMACAAARDEQPRKQLDDMFNTMGKAATVAGVGGGLMGGGPVGALRGALAGAFGAEVGSTYDAIVNPPPLPGECAP